MAVEDGAALACMLPYGTKPEEVASRLQAYRDIRKARGEFVATESLEQITIPSKRGLLHSCEPKKVCPGITTLKESCYLAHEMQDFLNGYDAIAVAQEHFNKTFGQS
jgi:hypothetical protein